MDWVKFPARLYRRLRQFINRELNQFSYNLQSIQPLGQPEVFQIELTNHCPMTCVMCPRTYNMKRSLGFMSRELFEKIAPQVAGFSSDIFLHHFGDSLVHPELGDLIRFASQLGIRCYLSTNPILLTEERSRQLVDSGLHELVISLDGATPQTSAAIRGPAARNIEKAEAQIRYLIQYRQNSNKTHPKIILQFVRQKMNEHECELWLEKWNGVEGIDEVKIKSYITWDGSEERINLLRLEDAPDRNQVVCDKPWTSVTILWDGRVVPCCFDYDGLFVLGNLNHETLDSIWRSERMQTLRESHRNHDLNGLTLCQNCTDKEGYSVRKITYPLNRLMTRQMPLGAKEPVPKDSTPPS